MIESLSVLEKFQSRYSDMYKALHGFRPTINCTWTLSDYESEFEYLQDCIRYKEDARFMREEEDTEEFERCVQGSR